MIMKRILLALTIALAGLFATSCVQEHIEAQFIPGNVTTQGLGQISGCTLAEDGNPITTSYSAVDFGLSVPVSYTLWMDISGNNFANAKKVDATIADGQISFAQKKFNKTLLNMGIAPETEVSVDFMLDAYMQTEKGSNIEKYVQHSNVVTAVFTVYEETKGDLPVVDVPGDYQGWAPSDYPKLFNYSYDEVIYRGVVDFQCKKEDGSAANGFKITGEGNWDSASGNWGSASQAEAPEAASVELINGDASQNIVCYGAKRYYLFEFNKDALTLTKLMSFDKVGVIGLNGDWDNDAVMTYNMFRGRFWVDVDLAADTEFKFRLDGAWDNNWGGDLEDLKGGAGNIPIPAGQHRIYFYMNDVTLYGEINDEMYGKDEPTVDPTPVPVPTFEGWSVIGTVNGGTEWDTDYDMEEIESGVFYINGVTLTADSEFKIRKDHDWTTSYGTAAGASVAIDVAFAATTDNGGNIKLGSEAKVDITLNTNENTILLASHKALYSLIGNIGGTSWNKDFNMTESEGKWHISEVQIDGEFKVRYDASWDDANCYGVADGQEYGVGTEFVLCQPGSNINFAAGKYNVTFDPTAKTLLVENAAKSWGVIGDFNSWGGDVKMSEIAPGIWVSDEAITNEEGKGFKVRFNSDWGVNRGGTPTVQGEFTEAAQDGSNIGVAGTFKVVYNANNETIGTLGFGVTGSIASYGINWDKDVPMNLAADGKYYSLPIALTDTDELKIRWGADWAVNRGGTCVEAETEFKAVDGGDNIKAPAAGTYVVVYDPTAETLSLSHKYWGLIGGFNDWGADKYLFALGSGKWAAYNQTIAGEWKCRKNSDWAVNFGGTFVELGTAFDVTQDGPNIVCEEEGIDIVLDTEAATITISK